MSRLIFEARRRLPAPETRKGTITIEAPPSLPRLVPPSLLRRVLPYLIVILIVGMIVALFATGMRMISPTMLFFPFVAAAGRDRALPRVRQQAAHRGGRRRTRRLPALPLGGPGQRPCPGRRSACGAGVVASRTGSARRGARHPQAVGARPGRHRFPGGAHRSDRCAAEHRACGSRTPQTRSTWNRWRTPPFAACSTCKMVRSNRSRRDNFSET